MQCALIEVRVDRLVSGIVSSIHVPYKFAKLLEFQQAFVLGEAIETSKD